jgi:hypothetical protein
MPKITNKITGAIYVVSDAGMNAIRNNPMTSRSFIFPDSTVDVPKDIAAFRKKRAEERQPEPISTEPPPIQTAPEERPVRDYSAPSVIPVRGHRKRKNK